MPNALDHRQEAEELLISIEHIDTNSGYSNPHIHGRLLHALVHAVLSLDRSFDEDGNYWEQEED